MYICIERGFTMAFSADPTFLGLLSIAIGVFMGLVSIAIAIYFGVRPTLRKLEKDVSEIKTNTEPIKRIEETTRRMDEKTTRLNERIDTFLKIIPSKTGTVELVNVKESRESNCKRGTVCK